MSRWTRVGVSIVCLFGAAAVVPRCVCGRAADRFFEGDLETQVGLAHRVVRSIHESNELVFYRTPYLRFNGQSAVAIYQMTLMGLGQIVLDHPEMSDDYLPVMLEAADRLVDPDTLRYAAEVYGRHGVAGMAPGEGHAYLGYVNLGLGMLRMVAPENRHAKLHDRLSAQLATRLDASPSGLIETYPGETWPPDIAAVAGSVGLHASATGTDRSAMLARWAHRFAACAIDDESGYLIQRVKSGTCKPVDAPRGSGTAVASYFIGFADTELSRRLHGALREEGRASFFGFGGIREYASGHSGPGDGNAGPIVLGISMGATGFALASARAHEDRELFTELYRTTHLFGVPIATSAELTFAVGGALGNALLLAMLTARPS